MSTDSLLARMRAPKGDLLPEAQTGGYRAACINEDGQLTYCALDGSKEVEQVDQDEPPMFIMPDDWSEQVEVVQEDSDFNEDYRWRNIELRDLAEELSDFHPDVFVERATPHGIYVIVEGNQHYLRYRYIFREEGADRPLAQLLDFMGVRFEKLDTAMVFDFSALRQTGLMFWQTRQYKRPVNNMVLTVCRCNRNHWEIQTSSN